MKLGFLAIPFIAIGIITFFLVDDKTTKAIVIAVSFLPIVLLYIFRPQIAWWYYSRNPQGLDKPMKIILQRFFPFYNHLSEATRIKFEHRMFMYMISKSYEKKVIQTIPEELKGLIAANAIMLTLGLEEYLSPKFETIVFFPNRFPSPAIQEFHSSETFEDGSHGGMIFAVDQVMTLLEHPNAYNIILHEQVNVLWKQNNWSEKDFLEYASPENLQKLAKIRGLSLPQVRNILGKPSINFYAMVLEHFFAEPQRFQVLLPDLYQIISNRLNQNPLEESNPVIVALEKTVN